MFQRKRWGGVGKVPRGFVCSFLLLIFVAASLLFPLSARAESGQADLDKLAPYADDGDLDYIPDYFVTVDLREDGSADIVYDITWQVIDGDQTDYLSWVKIGLPNAYAEDLTPLTDTISDLQYTGDGGSYAKVVFARRYYSPKVAAQNGGESRVRFAFSVHQSHLFSLNSDGTATFEFAPGWFDDLVVEHMQVRWRSGDGFVADNTSEEDGYLIWDFGPMGHGQSANIHVTVPVTTAETFDPDAQLTAADYDDGGMTADEMIGILTVVIGLLIFAAALIIIVGSMTPDWGGGFGSGLDPDDWFWYTNGVHTIHVARTAPPPKGYTRTDPPKNYHTGGGSSRGGGVGRHNSGCASSCACACACACAGGGRAGCSAKNLYGAIHLDKDSTKKLS
ncbi:MAG: hypothetical protein EGQ75_09295 [Clostridiales bacterium]|nr:hypothetical protein [Clostridiales bacterium]